MNPRFSKVLTVTAVIGCLVQSPHRHLVRRWNWKTAGLSSFSRGILILLANFAAGPQNALAAMFAESSYRALTSGFYSAFTQSFRFARPAWAASAIPMIIVPVISDTLEICIHGLRGTPRLGATALVSVLCTAVCTLFEWFAMRHGVFVIGRSQHSFSDDLKKIPALLMVFLGEGIQLVVAPIRGVGTRMLECCANSKTANAGAEPVE
jgi:hypothetical protein